MGQLYGECLPLSSTQQRDRARGALYGLAIGDALGMPTQLLSRQEIAERWGPLLAGFEPAPPGHPVAAGRAAGPVGVAVAADDLGALVDAVHQASLVTHNTSVALAGAAAVAAAVSTGVSGAYVAGAAGRREPASRRQPRRRRPPR